MKLNKKKIKKFLILRSDGLGDFIMSLPALHSLRSEFPNASITIFTGSWQAELAEKSWFLIY